MENLKSAILKSLYFSNTQSIGEISETIGKSVPLITKIVNELIVEQKIVIDGLRPSTGGRRATSYMLNVEAHGLIIAVAIDQYFVYVTSFNIINKRITDRLEEAISGLTEEEIYETVNAMIRNTLAQIKDKQVIAIGIAMPGFVDSETGVNNSYNPNSPVHNLRANVENSFNIPTFLENDSTAIAIAEKEFGLAKKSSEALVINLNWGVGLGMIINNRLYKGHSGFAGEFSHIPLANEDKLCSCGKKGCLEVEASLYCVVEEIKNAIQSGERSILETIDLNINNLTFEKIVDAYHTGDQVAIKAIRKIAHMLGKGIATLIHIMNPEKIIISGRGAIFGETLLPQIQSSIQEYCIPRLSKNTTIEISTLKELQLLASTCFAIQQIGWVAKQSGETME